MRHLVTWLRWRLPVLSIIFSVVVTGNLWSDASALCKYPFTHWVSMHLTALSGCPDVELIHIHRLKIRRHLHLDQWFSTDLELILPSGDVCQCLEMFLVVIIGRGTCSWHRVGRGQGCCCAPYNAQEAPTKRFWSRMWIISLFRNFDLDE